jgi:hypothetical protein
MHEAYNLKILNGVFGSDICSRDLGLRQDLKFIIYKSRVWQNLMQNSKISHEI